MTVFREGRKWNNESHVDFVLGQTLYVLGIKE